MTRINCVPPEELSAPHLIVELKEITRVYELSWKAFQRGEDPASFPQEYILGPGHVKFFYARLGYINHRHKILMDEHARRGFAFPLDKLWPWQAYIDNWWRNLRHWDETWLQNWEPTEEAMALNRARLKERMAVINSWK